MLMNQLDREDHPVIARQICNILLSNPAKMVLKALDDITRTSNPAVSMVISQARNDLFEIVSQMPAPAEPEPPEKREDLCRKAIFSRQGQRNRQKEPELEALL